MSDRVLLYDLTNAAHRAWHVGGGDWDEAYRALDGMIAKALSILKPTHAVCCMDSKYSWRKWAYPTYKGNKKERPPEQQDWLKAVHARTGFTTGLGHVGTFQVPGYEADDLLATFAAQARDSHAECYVYTSDSDAFALVDETTTVMRLTAADVGRSYDYFDGAAVKEKMGVWPHQVAAYKALAGDGSDNIAGAPGIGPVRAVALLNRYETFVGALAHLTSPPCTVPVQRAVEMALAAYAVVTLRPDAPDCVLANHHRE